MLETTSLTLENSSSLDASPITKPYAGLNNNPKGQAVDLSQVSEEASLPKIKRQAVDDTNLLSTNFDRSHSTINHPSQKSESLSTKPPLHKASQSAKGKRDQLTGLAQTQSLVGTQTVGQTSGTSFNTTYGYGLVNAAKAVAWSMGYYPYSLPEVPDWGGAHWGNDRVKAQEAWNWGVTGKGVTVAVIDSGVDITHPDLRNNIWYNSNEVAGDGVDNDGNGYVDDLYGWNFASNQYNNNVLPRFNNNDEAHGTHVAGTIAAGWNDFGTTGVAPDAKIMALRIGDTQSNNFINPGNLAEAVYYAVNNGARVINMSLGWTPSAELEQALSYAASRNVIVVSAAGNESMSQPSTPASYATHYGISVGAVDSNNWIANFSNRAGFDGRMQHVVAPGQEIWSTMPTNDYDGKYYDKMNGTSMAAPHVSGVVALMLSANPYLTHAQVRYILTASASSYGTGTYSNRTTAQQTQGLSTEQADASIALLDDSTVANINQPSLELQPSLNPQLDQFLADISLPSAEETTPETNGEAKSQQDELFDRFNQTLRFRETTPISIDPDELIYPNLKGFVNTSVL